MEPAPHRRRKSIVARRMLQAIDEYEAGRIDLRRLLDDLQAMYQSLKPHEQPDEKIWSDAFVPIDRLAEETPREDDPELGRRIAASLSKLRGLLSAP